MRSALNVWFSVTLLVAAGCTNMMTKHAIERFATGLQEQDLEKLRASSSTEFEQRALRIAEAPKDLKILKVPTDKFKIKSVENVDSTHRVATVTVGEEGRQQTLEYRLTKDPKTSHWVVDDLVISPQTDGQNPPSIAEQMDLLLTAREFLAAWHSTDRDSKLSFCTEDFQAPLLQLPPRWFDQVTARTVGTGRQRVARPEARIDGANAVVVVPHPDGELFLELKHSGTWLVNDAALQVKTDEGAAIPSVKKLAITLNQAAEFLSGYAAADRGTLAKVSTTEFYDRCLAAADLATVPLPIAELLVADFEMRHFKERRELLFESHDTSYMLTMKPVDVEQAAREGKNVEVKVDEVTIYEMQGREVKRVSAMFLSHAVVQLYGEALFERDLANLKKLSSRDFNDRVWTQETARLFTAMPLPEVESPDVQIISTVFRGDATEVTATQGSRAVTYILNLQDSWMVVDDMVFPSMQRPPSLKKNLEVLLPMYAFTSALHQHSLPDLLTNSGDGLDRIVWRQVDHVPDMHYDLLTALMLPVVGMQLGEPWSVVRLGNAQHGTEVKLVREGSRYVVHDVASWNGDPVAGRFELLPTLRQRLAVGDIPIKRYPAQRVIMQTSGVRQSAALNTADEGEGRGGEDVSEAGDRNADDAVSPAVYETLSPVE